MMAREVLGPIGNKTYKEYAGIVVGSAKQLLALVDDVLDLSKMEATGVVLKKETYDPVMHSKKVAASFTYISKEKNISLEVISGPDAPRLITGDPRVANQIQHLKKDARIRPLYLQKVR